MDAKATFATALLALALTAGDVRTPVAPTQDPPKFRIDAPEWVLSGVPASKIVVFALTPDGAIDTTYNGQPLITGLRLSLPNSSDTKLGTFQNGKLELSTDLAQSRKVFVTESTITVDPEGREPVTRSVRLINRWWSIVPVLLTVGLGCWLRNSLIPMFIGLLAGSIIISGSLIYGLRDLLETYLIGELLPTATASGVWDRSHIELLLITVFLAAMAGVMSASGSISAFAGKFERFSSDRERGQLLACASAVPGFFDSTLNMLLRGAMLRPMSDRLQISREKLAFLVDATASALAGLVVATTWIGLEYALVHDTYSRIGYESEVLTTLFASIPFRFYPLYLFLFAWMIAWLGNDFGPMRRAERRAMTEGVLTRPNSVKAFENADLPAANRRRELLLNLAVPIVTLLALLACGIWWSSHSAPNGYGAAKNLLLTVAFASPLRALTFAALAASLVSIAVTAATRALSIAECVGAWTNGVRTVAQPLVLLLLAWGIGRVCDPAHLNTAGFLLEIAPAEVSVGSMPALAFLLAAAVAFATGSSWTAAGILMPLFLTITHTLLVDIEEASPQHQLMLGTISAVLAGGLLGSHCSLMSAGTILASAGAGSDHYDHVATQIPYTLSVGGLSLLLGYFPAALGYSPGILLPIGTLAIFLIVQFAGRSPSASDEAPTAESESLSFTAELDAVIEESAKKKKRA